jgi:hypothetical protein
MDMRWWWNEHEICIGWIVNNLGPPGIGETAESLVEILLQCKINQDEKKITYKI